MRYFVLALFIIRLFSLEAQTFKLRSLTDTIGFASKALQMDKIMERINELQKGEVEKKLSNSGIKPGDSWKMAISPHDDYTYVGSLYPTVLQNIKAQTIILIGVAHKASTLQLEDQLIFDSYSEWKGPYSNVKVSSVREEIMKNMPVNSYQVNDSMQKIEHSVEAIIPFLQYFNRNVQIVSILVPYMNYNKMAELGKLLAKSIYVTAEKNNWVWGEDFAIVASTDAVHYGDEDWGGKNYARFGTTGAGYDKAVAFEHRIINECLSGPLKLEKIRKFTDYTVQEQDHREYKWTWCGRYSVPFAMLTAYYLQEKYLQHLNGIFLGYSTSIDHQPIPVSDIGLGITAPANLRHWVGYAGLGFK